MSQIKTLIKMCFKLFNIMKNMNHTIERWSSFGQPLKNIYFIYFTVQ